jgi:hypothetical protein
MLEQTPSQSHSTDITSKASITSLPEIYSPNHDDPVDMDEVDKMYVERRRLSSLDGLSHPRGEAHAFQHNEPDNGFLYSPVPLCQPHHGRSSSRNSSLVLYPFTHPYSIQSDQDTPSSSPGLENEGGPSPTPSLVPTVIGSRSPSPQPHPCVAQAQETGIRVRDFAQENHGVRLARPIPNIDQLKFSYCLYRNADLIPPIGVIDTLKAHDSQWVTDTEEQTQKSSSQPKSESRDSSPLPWRRKTDPWRGFEKTALCSETPAEDESCLASEITPCLEAISLADDARGGEVIGNDA